jgi:hypothetical protein
MRIILFLFFFIFNFQYAFTQQPGAISGVVKDLQTGEPLPFANVFLNNTTVGATTNQAGEFHIHPPQYGSYKLIVSYIGYETYEKEVVIHSGVVLRIPILMAPAKRMLNEISVKASRDKEWEKLIKEFEFFFLGNTKTAKKAKILNPGIIDLSKEQGILKAYANEPIIIENQDLGYLIHYYLKAFSVSKEDYRIEGYARFSELEQTTNQQKVAALINRNASYKGSLQHFLRSCIEGNIEAEGFRIYYDTVGDNLPIHLARHNWFAKYEKMLVPAAPHVEFIQPDSASALIRINHRLEIHYLNKKVDKRYYADVNHQVSRLFVSDSVLQCLPDGIIIKENSNWTVWGDMAHQRIGDLMPGDFRIAQGDNLQVTGTIADAKTKRNLKQANIFLNQTTIGTFTDNIGGFAFTDIAEGYYDLVIIKKGYAPFVSRLRIESGKSYKLNLQVEPARLLARSSRKTTKILAEQLSLLSSSLGLNARDSSYMVNPEVLKIFKRGNDFYSYNEDALQIINKLTGFEIFYYANPDNAISRNTTMGYYWFRPIIPRNHEERNMFEKGRLAAFQGSLRHLLSSVINKTYEHSGFKLFDKEGNTVLPVVDTTKHLNGYYRVSLRNADLINFIEAYRISDLYDRLNFRSTAILKQDSAFLVNNRGVLFKPNSLQLSGMQAPSLLPLDYVPVAPRSIWGLISDYRESVNVTTSKGYYHQGDVLFFKAYLQYANPSVKDSLSRILHVEVVNSDREIVYHKMLKIEDGIAAGAFVLDRELPPGMYQLRAYTRWMLNFYKPFGKSIQLLPATHNFKISLKLDDKSERSFGNAAPVINILANKKQYNRREKIDITIAVSDSVGRPVTTNLSCTVTDAMLIAHTNRSESRNHRIQESVKMPGYPYPVERTLSLEGKVLNAKGRIVRMQLVNLNNQIFEETSTDLDGNFKLFMPDFFDSLNLRVATFYGNRKFEPEVAMTERDAPAVSDIMQDTQDDFIPDHRLFLSKQYDNDMKTIILKEVVVRSTKIETWLPKYSLIKPEYVFKADEVHSMGTNLLLGLQGKVPGVLVRCQGSDCQIVISRTIGGTIFGIREPLVLLDDTPLYGESAGAIIGNMDPSQIDRIAIQRSVNSLYGADGRNGVIALYTKIGSGNMSFQNQETFDHTHIDVKGFSNAEVFHGPDYTSSATDQHTTDYRTTLYHNPFLTTNEKNGTTSFSFFAADIPTVYRIYVEGYTLTGERFYANQYVRIK